MSVDCNSRYCFLDPFEGGNRRSPSFAKRCMFRGVPLAITDCLNFGSPEAEDVMWQFIQAVEGMSEAWRGF